MFQMVTTFHYMVCRVAWACGVCTDSTALHCTALSTTPSMCHPCITDLYMYLRKMTACSTPSISVSHATYSYEANHNFIWCTLRLQQRYYCPKQKQWAAINPKTLSGTRLRNEKSHAIPDAVTATIGEL